MSSARDRRPAPPWAPPGALAAALFALTVALVGCGPAQAPTATRTPPRSAAAAALATATPAPAAVASPSTSAGSPLYRVVQVVDGDTIKVDYQGRVETVRIIGIDTPETVSPRQPVQCFGREASAKAHELLEGQRVHLTADPTQDSRDRYGRLLAYVDREDGVDFGLWMISNGYAHEYTYNVPYQRQAAYRAAEAAARAAERGLWAPDTCAGDTKKPAGASP